MSLNFFYLKKSSENLMILMTANRYWSYELLHDQIEVIFNWIPSHVRLISSHNVDLLAKMLVKMK